ncbi:MAG: hypothetical protein HY398_02125 [Candidatus Doudnabacteria bacterium]|nr:hypothetical protein [Candidatus Doudnabacteria bacterium]
MVHFDLETELKPKPDNAQARRHREIILFWQVAFAVAVILLLIFALS